MHDGNKAIVDIRLRPRCAVAQLTLYTHLRCAGIFYYRFTTYSLVSLSVKEF